MVFFGTNMKLLHIALSVFVFCLLVEDVHSGQSAPTTVVVNGKTVEVTFISGDGTNLLSSDVETDDFGKPLPKLGPAICSSLQGPSCSFMQPIAHQTMNELGSALGDLLEKVLNESSGKTKTKKSVGEDESDEDEDSEDEDGQKEPIASQTSISGDSETEQQRQSVETKTISEVVSSQQQQHQQQQQQQPGGAGTTGGIEPPNGVGKIYQRKKKQSDRPIDKADKHKMDEFAKSHNIPNDIAEYFKSFADNIEDDGMEYQAFIMDIELELDAEHEGVLNEVVEELLVRDKPADTKEDVVKTFVMDSDGVRELEDEDSGKYVSVEKFLKDAFAPADEVNAIKMTEKADFSGQKSKNDLIKKQATPQKEKDEEQAEGASTTPNTDTLGDTHSHLNDALENLNTFVQESEGSQVLSENDETVKSLEESEKDDSKDVNHKERIH